MSRHYVENKCEVVVERSLESVTCDCCGATTTRIDNTSTPNWDEPPIYKSGEVAAHYGCMGEYDGEAADLCYDCATWLIEQLRRGHIKRAN